MCTIHQPNSDITDCFHDFLLLAGGRTMYGGLWSGAVDFFAGAGYRWVGGKGEGVGAGRRGHGGGWRVGGLKAGGIEGTCSGKGVLVRRERAHMVAQ